MSATHYIKHINIIQLKEIPRKSKGTTMIHSGMRPPKKKHSPFTDSCCATALCFDLGRVNTACDDLPVPGRQHSLSLNPL